MFSNVVCLFSSRAYYPLAWVLASRLAADAARAYDIVIYTEATDLPAPDGVSLREFPLARAVPAAAPATDRMPRLAYYRLFMAEALPAQYRRAIYLDSDITLQGSLNPLFALNLDGRAIAAVRDCGFVKRADPIRARQRDDYLRAIGVDPDGFYFNNGALVCDLDAWRTMGVAAKAAAFLEKFGARNTGADQDAANAIFAGAALELSPRWNFQAPYFGFGLETILDPVVFHHLEKLRPWHDVAYAPDEHSLTYQRALAGSPFSGFIRDSRKSWHYSHALKWRARRALRFLPPVGKRFAIERRKAAIRGTLALNEIGARLAAGAYADIDAARSSRLAGEIRGLSARLQAI